MIVHVVLFEPKPGTDAAALREIAIDLHRAATTIPAVLRFRIGRRVLHGLPGYEQMMTEPYSFAAVIEFANREGLAEYLKHPAHETLGGHFAAAASRSLAYDYEMVDAAAMDPEMLSALV